MGATGWTFIAVGAAGGVLATLAAGAVRDAVLDAVDAVHHWWWRMLDAARRLLLAAATLALTGLAGWAVVVLLLPRLK